MFGAIVGDVLGSALEFEERKYENINDINLYNENNHFTDDTVFHILRRCKCQHVYFGITAI